MGVRWKDRPPAATRWLVFKLLYFLPFTIAAVTSTNILDDKYLAQSAAEHLSFRPLHLQLYSLSTPTENQDDDSNIIVSIPPLLEEGPPKGELLFRVTHDPEQEPENLTIPCKADALPAPSYSWFKNGGHFSTEEDRVHGVEGEGTIVIPNPQPEDEGDYQCVATNAAGSVFSDIVNVRRSITISFPKGEPRVVTAKLGEPLQLTCSNPGGYPKPSLHWVIQKSDGRVHSVSSERATVDEEGTLWFGAVTQRDASDDFLYACAASSSTSEREIFVVEEDGEIKLEDQEPLEGDFVSLNLQTEYRMGNWIYLNVTVPAHFEGDDVTLPESDVPPFKQFVSTENVDVLKEEDVRLHCIYGGIPIPKVRWWSEDKKDISPDHVVEFGKVLEFIEIDEGEEGKYFCQATNDAGKGEIHSFNLNVEAVPEIVEEPGTINQPIGESAEFKCFSTGDPEPEITWSFNGEPLEGKKENTLKFEYLSVEDRGVIACNASNKHGYAYSTGFLNVLILPPEFTTKPENMTGFTGKAVTLECEGYGSPDPEIIWARVDDEGGLHEISENDEKYSLSEGHLTIKTLNEETDGTYECRAKNKFGEVKTAAVVKLIESPQVDLTISEEKRKAGEEITLHCSVSVDEQLNADVTWIKDDKPIDFSNPRIKSQEDKNGDNDAYDRVLIISDSKGSDSGVFACVAKTEEDEVEDFAILTVEDVPEAPHITEIECSAREAYMKWNPGGENNSPIIRYDIQLQTEADKGDWHDTNNEIPASAESAKVELHPGLSHSFRITAVNEMGSSLPSLPSDSCHAPVATPDYNPRNAEATTVDSSTIQVNWDVIEPLYHNGPGFRYELSWMSAEEEEEEEGEEEEGVENDDKSDDDDDWSKIVVEDWEQKEAKLEGLKAHTKYKIRLATVNDHGAAPEPHDIFAFTDADVPTASPTNLRVRRITGTTAILFWIPVASKDVVGPLKGYEADVWQVSEDADKDGKEDDDEDGKGDKDDRIVMGRVSRVSLDHLEPFTKYASRVRVLNEKFAGPYTELIHFTTAQAVSSPVTELEARSLSTDSILVEWKSPVKPRGIITNYLVRYQPIYQDKKKESSGKAEGVIEEIVCDVDENQIKLSDLEEETLYRISVIPRNSAGLGEISIVNVQTEKKDPSIPVPPIFSWGVVQRESDPSTTTSRAITDRDNDNDIDEFDIKYQNVVLADTDEDGDVDKDDVLDTDNDGDIDENDFAVADIDNDGNVDKDDVQAADRDGDGDVDKIDIGDQDEDGDFDANDVLVADKDKDGDIDAKDDDEEKVILQDVDKDGDIDEDDVVDIDGDGDIDEEDIRIADIDNDGDVDDNDLKSSDKDGDGDIDGADVMDMDGDGYIDEEDLKTKDRDGDGDVDHLDYTFRSTFVGDTDEDGDVDNDDVLDTDGDGDIDQEDKNVADIDNDGDVDLDDVQAADRDGDGDVDANDVGDEDGDGDIDAKDVILADKDGDGDIDAADKNEEGTIFEDTDGDGNLDEKDVTDLDKDGDIDADDVAILDVNDDGKIDNKDLSIIDKDGDGDVDAADVTDFDGDGKIGEEDLKIVDKDGDGDIDAFDRKYQGVFLKDTDNDGDIDENDVLDINGDGEVDEEDIKIADTDDDGDVDANDFKNFDKDKDGDIDENDISDLDGDGRIDEDDFDVTDKDGDGDVDADDYNNRKIFLSDTDGDGDVDEDDVLDNDGDGDVDEEDIDVADIDKDGDIDKDDIKAGDVDGDGDVDFGDVGDEDGDGDIDAADLIAADEDKDGDIDANDDNGESIFLTDNDGDGDIDEDDVTDVDGDGDIDSSDKKLLDIDNDGDIDKDDLKGGDTDGDGDIDAADIVDFDGDGDIDNKDLLAADRDNDGDIDQTDKKSKDVFLKDVDGDGDVDSEDILDTDRDGDIDEKDFFLADINNDGVVNEKDIVAADKDGDGDVDVDDIEDEDGDGDIDADDVEAADRDGDGDIDLADDGEGIDIKINMQPDFENNPGTEFYVRYRRVGEEFWRKSNIEKKSLHQTLRGLDPHSTYEVQMVAKDGEYETPSNITMIGPFTQEPIEDPTVGAVMDDSDPLAWTWFIIALMVAVTMIFVILFSIWVYNQRITRVSELRAQLYEGYEPPTVVEVKKGDLESGLPPEAEADEPLTADKQRQQMAALLRRQETVQSVDSFASHDDDFAEYGDETMGTTFNEDGSLVVEKQV